jgi:hypothetical protein
MKAPKIAALLFTLLGTLFARSPLLHACAVCLTGADGASADAYDWSVLFLMTTPYLVVGSIAGCLVYAYRRAVARRSKDGAAEQAPLHMAWNQKESGR